MIPEELVSMFEEINAPVICIISDGGEPHASTMNWWFEEDKKTFFMNPAKGTKKAKLMQVGEKVCFATIENMKWENRGFMIWGVITKVEKGFSGLLKNLRNKYRILVIHGGLGLNLDSMRFWLKYAFHSDIYYSTLPWRGSFVTVKPEKAKYWLKNGAAREVEFPEGTPSG